MNNIERFKKDLSALLLLGDEMFHDLDCERLAITAELDKAGQESWVSIKGSFVMNYQRWFTEASVVLKQLLPDRLPEFIHLYHGDGTRTKLTLCTYYIQDWLNALTCGDYSEITSITVMRFKTQFEILKSVQSRFESSLFDIVRLVRAELFDSELDAARELTQHGFLRGAGAITGVVIEKHLAQVCANHNVAVPKPRPTISDFNDLLKKALVLDVPSWRQIQRLADIRNLCDHNGEREPTQVEITELIDGTDKLCKTLF